MARLLRPVMKIISVMPAATASSTAYWISGLSTMGSISFGCSLVAGRKRLPRPATGNTAFLILDMIFYLVLAGFQQRQKACLVQYGHFKFLGLGQLAAGIGPCYQIMRLLGYRTGYLAALRLDHGAGLVAAQIGQSARQDKGLAGQRAFGGLLRQLRQQVLAQLVQCQQLLAMA